jgi:hypothetical protein
MCSCSCSSSGIGRQITCLQLIVVPTVGGPRSSKVHAVEYLEELGSAESALLSARAPCRREREGESSQRTLIACSLGWRSRSRSGGCGGKREVCSAVQYSTVQQNSHDFWQPCESLRNGGARSGSDGAHSNRRASERLWPQCGIELQQCWRSRRNSVQCPATSSESASETGVSGCGLHERQAFGRLTFTWPDLPHGHYQKFQRLNPPTPLAAFPTWAHSLQRSTPTACTQSV